MVRNLHEMGRELGFSGDFSGVLKRISVRPEEHGVSIKKRCLEVKNEDFLEKCVTLKKGHGHVRFPTVHEISHVSDLEMSC